MSKALIWNRYSVFMFHKCHLSLDRDSCHTLQFKVLYPLTQAELAELMGRGQTVPGKITDGRRSNSSLPRATREPRLGILVVLCPAGQRPLPSTAASCRTGLAGTGSISVYIQVCSCFIAGPGHQHQRWPPPPWAPLR